MQISQINSGINAYQNNQKTNINFKGFPKDKKAITFIEQLTREFEKKVGDKFIKNKAKIK